MTIWFWYDTTLDFVKIMGIQLTISYVVLYSLSLFISKTYLRVYKFFNERQKYEQKKSLKLKVYISEDLLSWLAPFLIFLNVFVISMHLTNASPTMFENKRGSSLSTSNTVTYNANQRSSFIQNQAKIFTCYLLTHANKV